MFDLIIFLILMACGYFIGSSREKSHYKSIIKREKELNSILSFSAKTPPPDVLAKTEHTQLVDGSVVISVDYFKRFVAGLRNFFGGRMGTYESLLDRGRREAILRMKESAASLGADMIFNIKLETASISKGRENSVGSIEVYAYGTAVKLSEAVKQPTVNNQEPASAPTQTRRTPYESQPIQNTQAPSKPESNQDISFDL